MPHPAQMSAADTGLLVDVVEARVGSGEEGRPAVRAGRDGNTSRSGTQTTNDDAAGLAPALAAGRYNVF